MMQSCPDLNIDWTDEDVIYSILLQLAKQGETATADPQHQLQDPFTVQGDNGEGFLTEQQS